MKHPENKTRDVKPKIVPNKAVEGKADTKKPHPSIKETIQKFRADKPSNEGKLNKVKESKGELSKGVKSTKEDTRKQKLLSAIKSPEPTLRKSKVEGKAPQQEVAKGNQDNPDNKKFNIFDAYKGKINEKGKESLTNKLDKTQLDSVIDKSLTKTLQDKQQDLKNEVSSIHKNADLKEMNYIDKETESTKVDKSEKTSINSEIQENRVLSDAKQDTNEKSLYEKKTYKNSNRENECWEKQTRIVGDYYDSLNNFDKNKEQNNFKLLNDKEKNELSNLLKKHIDSVPKGERGNYRVPEPEKIKGISINDKGEARIIENWKPATDGTKEGTRRMEIVKTKTEEGFPVFIDRIGSNGGTYFSPLKENGTPYDLCSRAIGDYLPEKNINDNDSYHLYKVKKDFTRENLEKSIYDTYSDVDVIEEMIDKLDAYYNDASRSVNTNGHDGDVYKYEGVFPDGLKAGIIDNMFGTEEFPDGGGKQFITPFSAKELEKTGMIEEVNKEEYK